MPWCLVALQKAFTPQVFSKHGSSHVFESKLQYRLSAQLSSISHSGKIFLMQSPVADNPYPNSGGHTQRPRSSIMKPRSSAHTHCPLSSIL